MQRRPLLHDTDADGAKRQTNQMLGAHALDANLPSPTPSSSPVSSPHRLRPRAANAATTGSGGGGMLQMHGALQPRPTNIGVSTMRAVGEDFVAEQIDASSEAWHEAAAPRMAMEAMREDSNRFGPETMPEATTSVSPADSTGLNQSEEPDTVVRFDDAQAIDMLRTLVRVWDDHHCHNGLPPMLDSLDDENFKRQCEARRHLALQVNAAQDARDRAAAVTAAATKLAKEKVAAEIASTESIRRARLKELARHVPPMPPNSPRPMATSFRPSSARRSSPADVQRQLRMPRRPATAGSRPKPQQDRSAETWPLPMSIVAAHVIKQESRPRLYNWWSAEGYLTSPGSMTLPTALDQPALARVARASGETVLRAGHPVAAARFFRRAACLGHGESQFRVRECETHARGGLAIVRKVGGGSPAAATAGSHHANRQRGTGGTSTRAGGTGGRGTTRAGSLSRAEAGDG
jgi:hypothetical protein